MTSYFHGSSQIFAGHPEKSVPQIQLWKPMIRITNDCIRFKVVLGQILIFGEEHIILIQSSYLHNESTHATFPVFSSD